MVGFQQPLSASWWGAGTSLFVGMIAGFIVLPGPVKLTSVWLLPVGVTRAALGETVFRVWMGRARVRIALGVVLAAAIILLVHAVDPTWPQWRTQMYGVRSLSEKLLWA